MSIRNEERKALFHVAVKQGNSETVNALIEAKVDINTPDNMGMTALYCAVKNSAIQIETTEK